MKPLEYDAGAFPLINGTIIEDLNYFPTGHNSNVRISFRGENSWCIVNLCSCLNKNGEWEYENLPSSRTQDFLERTRFQTPEQAYEYFLNWRTEFLKQERGKNANHDPNSSGSI